MFSTQRYNDVRRWVVEPIRQYKTHSWIVPCSELVGLKFFVFWAFWNLQCRTSYCISVCLFNWSHLSQEKLNYLCLYSATCSVIFKTFYDRTERTAEHSTAQHSTAQHSTAQHSTAQHSTAQHSTAQHSTAQHSTAQHSTAQHSTAQHSTAQHNTLLRFLQHNVLVMASNVWYPIIKISFGVIIPQLADEKSNTAVVDMMQILFSFEKLIFG